MRFVAKCDDCGEQRILDERWARCKSCLKKWFEKCLIPADFITDPDQWYILAPDPDDPQPDPAKVDTAVAKMKLLDSQIQTDSAGRATNPADFTDAAIAQRKLNLLQREMLGSPKMREMMRDIFAKYSKQKLYPGMLYPPPKCDEKI